MSVIAVYRNDLKHTIQPTGWLHDRTDQALATMQRFRNRFDVALSGLSILEVEDTVSVGDVVGVVQAAEMVLRIAEEVDGYLVELGEDGRLVGLQSAELVDGVARALHLVVRDYCRRRPSKGADRLAVVEPGRRTSSPCLTSDELRDAGRVAEILGLPGSFHDTESGVEPRGYRLLYRLPRFSDVIIERIVDRFVNLQQIMRASWASWSRSRGWVRPGPTRSRTAWPAWPRRASSSATSSRPAAEPDRAATGMAGAVGHRHRVPLRASLRGPDVAHPARDPPATPGGTVFDIGDKVVYPHHGAAVVERRETKEAFGKKQEYLVLRLAYGDLTLMVPADNTDGVGLREVINDEEVEEVFAVLRKKEARMPTNWSRRYKNHSEKLRSGDIYQVAEVVRNLSIRDKDKGLSAGEKRMLQRARQILVSELTFALGVDEETAEVRLNEALP